MKNMEQPVAQPTDNQPTPASTQEGAQTTDGLLQSQGNKVEGQITNA